MLYERYSVSMVVLNRIVKLSLGRFSSVDKANDIARFFEEREVTGFEASLRQVLFTHYVHIDLLSVLNLSTDCRDGSKEMRRGLRIGWLRTGI
jgi:hypothetical protein